MIIAAWLVIRGFFAVHSRLPLLLAVGVITASMGGMALRCKILTLERDAAVSARVAAEESLHHVQRVDTAQLGALTKAREEDHDREKFIGGIERAIGVAGKAGDGPLAPVLRDALERVRSRYAGRAAAALHQRQPARSR